VPFRRLVAGLILGLFSLNSVAWSALSFSNHTLSSYLSLPSNLGTFQESFDASGSDFTVIHIQDSHASVEAQEKIRDILKWFARKKSLLIALEGSLGPLHPEYLNFFPDYPQVNETLVQDLVKQSVLSGSELVAWEKYRQPSSYANEIQFVGVETPELYRADLEVYRNFFNREEEINTGLNQFRQALDSTQTKIFNPELRKFLQEIERRKEGDYPSGVNSPNLVAYTRFLAGAAFESLKIDLRDRLEQIRFPNLTRLLFLIEEGEALKSQDRSALQSELVLKGLFKEMETLEKGIRQQLIHHSNEQILLGIRDDFKLLEKLLRLELSREEYLEILNRREEILPAVLWKRLAMVRQHRSGHSSEPSLNPYYQSALRFYSLAEKRNSALLQNTLKEAERIKKTSHQKPLVILVAGGFHTEGLVQLMKKRKISYGVVSPQIEQADFQKNHYQELMTGRWHPASSSDHLAWARLTDRNLRESLSGGLTEQAEILRSELRNGKVQLGRILKLSPKQIERTVRQINPQAIQDARRRMKRPTSRSEARSPDGLFLSRPEITSRDILGKFFNSTSGLPPSVRGLLEDVDLNPLVDALAARLNHIFWNLGERAPTGWVADFVEDILQSDPYEIYFGTDGIRWTLVNPMVRIIEETVIIEMRKDMRIFNASFDILHRWLARMGARPHARSRSETRQQKHQYEDWFKQNAPEFYGKTLIHVSPGFKPSPEWLNNFTDPDMRALVANGHQTGGLEPLVTEELVGVTEMGMNGIGISLLYRDAPFQKEDGTIVYKPIDYSDAIRAGKLIELGEVKVPIQGRQDSVKVWLAPFVSEDGASTVILYLDHPTITTHVYSDDLRYQQMLLLGRGALALVKEFLNKLPLAQKIIDLDLLPFLKIEPVDVQMNEALSVFAHPQAIDDELTDDPELNALVYGLTTHTPVGAGLQKFHVSLAEEIRINPHWGPWILSDGQLDMTNLGMLLADNINGVSQEHGEITEKELYPAFKGLIWKRVNGVYLPHWQLKEMASLVGAKYEKSNIQKMLQAHQAAKERFADWVEKKTGIRPDTQKFFSTEARRKTGFKAVDGFNRALQDAAIRNKFLESEAIQIFLGKPSIRDKWGIARVKEIIALTQGRIVQVNEYTMNETLIAEDKRLIGRVFFIPNFNAAEADYVFQGADSIGMWSLLQTEASATGYQKGLANAIPTLASKTGGPLEHIRNGINGLLIDGYESDGRPTPAGLIRAITEMAGIFAESKKAQNEDLPNIRWHRMMWRALQTSPEVDIKTVMKDYITELWYPAYQDKQKVARWLAADPKQTLSEENFRSLLSASLKQRYGQKVMLAKRVRQFLEKQSPGSLRKFFLPISQLTLEEARKEFGEEAIPRVMELVSVLTPELINNEIKNWNPDVISLLEPAKEINEQGKLVFLDSDDDAVMHVARVWRGRRNVVPVILAKPSRRVNAIHFSAKQNYEEIARFNDGKIWVRVIGVEKIGIQPDRVDRSIYELTVRNNYHSKSGYDLTHSWKVGIPVIPGYKDQNRVVQPGWGFQSLLIEDPQTKIFADAEHSDEVIRSEVRSDAVELKLQGKPELLQNIQGESWYGFAVDVENSKPALSEIARMLRDDDFLNSSKEIILLYTQKKSSVPIVRGLLYRNGNEQMYQPVSLKPSIQAMIVFIQHFLHNELEISSASLEHSLERLPSILTLPYSSFEINFNESSPVAWLLRSEARDPAQRRAEAAAMLEHDINSGYFKNDEDRLVHYETEDTKTIIDFLMRHPNKRFTVQQIADALRYIRSDRYERIERLLLERYREIQLTDRPIYNKEKRPFTLYFFQDPENRPMFSWASLMSIEAGVQNISTPNSNRSEARDGAGRFEYVSGDLWNNFTVLEREWREKVRGGIAKDDIVSYESPDGEGKVRIYRRAADHDHLGDPLPPEQRQGYNEIVFESVTPLGDLHQYRLYRAPNGAVYIFYKKDVSLGEVLGNRMLSSKTNFQGVQLNLNDPHPELSLIFDGELPFEQNFLSIRLVSRSEARGHLPKPKLVEGADDNFDTYTFVLQKNVLELGRRVNEVQGQANPLSPEIYETVRERYEELQTQLDGLAARAIEGNDNHAAKLNRARNIMGMLHEEIRNLEGRVAKLGKDEPGLRSETREQNDNLREWVRRIEVFTQKVDFEVQVVKGKYSSRNPAEQNPTPQTFEENYPRAIQKIRDDYLELESLIRGLKRRIEKSEDHDYLNDLNLTLSKMGKLEGAILEIELHFAETLFLNFHDTLDGTVTGWGPSDYAAQFFHLRVFIDHLNRDKFAPNGHWFYELGGESRVHYQELLLRLNAIRGDIGSIQTFVRENRPVERSEVRLRLDSTWEWKKFFTEGAGLQTRLALDSRLREAKNEPAIRNRFSLGFFRLSELIQSGFSIPEARAAIADFVLSTGKASPTLNLWMERMGLPAVSGVQKAALIYLPGAAFGEFPLLPTIDETLQVYGEKAFAGIVTPVAFRSFVEAEKKKTGEEKILQSEELEALIKTVVSRKPTEIVIFRGDEILPAGLIRELREMNIRVEIITVTRAQMERANASVPGIADQINSFRQEIESLKTAA